MNQDYLDYKCIRKLSDAKISSLKAIVNKYGEILNKEVPHDMGTVFTLHDFDHHCYNIYDNICFMILLDDAWDKLKEYEIYLLDLAVLLHDIGMTKCTEVDRENHSGISADMIEKAYRNSSDPLSEKKSQLGRNEIRALQRIVRAHSNMKEHPEGEENNGLKDKKLTNTMPGKATERVIRARFLANILRMADELDITNRRLGEVEIEQELEEKTKELRDIRQKLSTLKGNEKKEELQKRIEQLERTEKSNEHWKRLYLFNRLYRDKAGIVYLCVNDELVEHRNDQGIPYSDSADEIYKVYQKIYKEFQLFKEDVEKEVQLSSLVGMKGLDICTECKDLEEKLKKIMARSKDDCSDRSTNEDILYPTVLSEVVQDKLSRFVEKRDLFQVGHFKLHDNLCARDWITAEEVIETSSIFKDCEELFILDLKESLNLEEKNVIVGIDFAGMLIASKLAFIFRIPFTYVIPSHKTSSSSFREQEVDIQKYEKIILVTDVIVTFKTIQDIIEYYEMGDRLYRIYAVFFRDTEEQKYLKNNQDLAKKTFVLNRKFNIELHENDKCPYKGGEQCKASNRKYN